MTRIIAFLLIVPSFLLAQAPDKFNYQSIVRDNGGTPIINQNVSFRISILESNVTGTVIYSETHQITTNDFGAASFLIGTGQIVQGDFATIDWGSDSHFLKTELDVAGGTNYVEMGTAQLVSVPYALYANEAKTSKDGKSYLTFYGDITDNEAVQKTERESGPNTQIISSLYTTQLSNITSDSIQELFQLTLVGNSSLVTVDMEDLKFLIGGVGNFATISNNTLLSNLNLSNLEFVANGLLISNNALSSIDLSNLGYAAGLRLQGETSLNSIDLSSLVSCRSLYVNYNPNLSTLIIPSVDFSQSVGELRLNDNAFDSSTINSFLAQLVAANTTGLTIWLQNQNPPAPPTGQGLVDKQNLIDNGNTVLTD